jgi:hypothetical protein
VKIRVLRGFSMVWMPHPRRRWKVVPSAWRTLVWRSQRPWGCHVATAIIPDVLRIGSWESCDAPCAMLQWNEWSVTTQIFAAPKGSFLWPSGCDEFSSTVPPHFWTGAGVTLPFALNAERGPVLTKTEQTWDATEI